MQIAYASRLYIRNVENFRRFWYESVLPQVFEPILYLGAMGWGVGQIVDDGSLNGQSYVEFIVPGVAAAAAMGGAVFESTYFAFYKLRGSRIYESILATPLETRDIGAAELAWATTRGFIQGLFVILVAALTGVVDTWRAVLWLPVIALVALLFSGLGFACVAQIRRGETLTLIQRFVVTPLFLFSGVFFPIAKVSDAGAVIANISPVYHAVEVERATARGDFDAAAALHLGVLTAFACACCYIGLRRFSNALIDGD
ncbi:ABC transporter permease [Embleya sp. NPDC005575]|uniref:ABC transporter permease n=1 Tax=Embleya sp. NPDC005575 TaxID=3156892 RepID=UPI0033B2FAC4